MSRVNRHMFCEKAKPGRSFFWQQSLTLAQQRRTIPYRERLDLILDCNLGERCRSINHALVQATILCHRRRKGTRKERLAIQRTNTTPLVPVTSKNMDIVYHQTMMSRLLPGMSNQGSPGLRKTDFMAAFAGTSDPGFDRFGHADAQRAEIYKENVQ